MNVVDITGQRFGRLTVLEMAAPDENKKGVRWRCLCDCGNEKILLGIALRRGHYQSCGCLRRDNIQKVRLQYLQNDPDWKNKPKKDTSCP